MLSKTVLLLAAAATSTTALQLGVNNWCNDDVHIYQANPGVCGNGDASMSGQCGGYDTIKASNGQGNLQFYNFIENNEGTSVKMSRASNNYQGIMQYEYTMDQSAQYGGLYWDLSMLDGDGPSRTGSPFYNDNVKVSPTGAGAGQNTCIQFRCSAGQVCKDAYQTPSQTATRFCPANTGTMYLDLCEPNPQFSNRKREMLERFERRELSERDVRPLNIGVGGLHDLKINATQGISGSGQ